MNKNKYFLISGIFFGAVSCMHFIRALNGWQFQVDSLAIPIWMSWFAFVVTGFLCASAFKLMKE